MGLNKAKLIQDLKELRNFMKTIDDPGQADNEFANRLANIIDEYVKSAEVTVVAPSGSIVVVGSPTTQNNPAPITIQGNPNNPPPLKGGLS